MRAINKNSFLYRAGILATSNTLLLLLNFLYRILLGRLAGPEGLGVYTLAIQVYSIAMSICVYGLSLAVTNVASSLHQCGDIRGVRRLVFFALSCFFVLFFVSAIPILLFKNQIAEYMLGDIRTAQSMVAVLFCIFLTGIENIIKALFNGTGQVKFTAVSEVGEQLLRIIIAATLIAQLINNNHSYTSFLIITGMALSEVYSVAFLLSRYYKSIIKPSRSVRGIKTSAIRRKYLRVAIPSAMTSTAATLFSSITTILFPQRLLLAGYTHRQAVSTLGLLSGMVTPVLLLPSSLVSALCTLLMPSIAASLARGDKKDLANKVDKSIEVIGFIGLPATAMIMPFVPLLCSLLFAQTAPVELVAVLSISIVLSYYLIVAVSILNGLGRQKHVLVFAVVSELLQVALVYVLCAMPTLHIYGYLAGMMIGDLLRLIISFIFINRLTPIKPRIFHKCIVPTACAVVVYCVVRLCFFVFTSTGVNVIAAIVFSIMASTAVYIVLLRLMGVNIVGYIRRTLLNDRAD